jgi:hypothetical protein
VNESIAVEATSEETVAVDSAETASEEAIEEAFKAIEPALERTEEDSN